MAVGNFIQPLYGIVVALPDDILGTTLLMYQ